MSLIRDGAVGVVHASLYENTSKPKPAATTCLEYGTWIKEHCYLRADENRCSSLQCQISNSIPHWNWISGKSWNHIMWHTSLIQPLARLRGSPENRLDCGLWKVPEHQRGKHGTWKLACGRRDKWMNRLRRNAVSLTLPAISPCSWQGKDSRQTQRVNATRGMGESTPSSQQS